MGTAIIQNQADHEAAKALVNKLMQSNKAAGRARIVAQARHFETHKRTRGAKRRRCPTC